MKTTAVLRSMKELPLNDCGFCVDRYTDEENPAPFLHHHDYYEVVIYLGIKPLEFVLEDRHYTIVYGDIVLCGMLRDHEFCFENGMGYGKLHLRITPEYLQKLAGADADFSRIFGEENPNFPVYHPQPERKPRYLDLAVRIAELEREIRKNSGSEARALQQALIHLLLADLYYEGRKTEGNAE